MLIRFLYNKRRWRGCGSYGRNDDCNFIFLKQIELFTNIAFYIVTVSYTHLDVYKRQGQPGNGTAAGNAGEQTAVLGTEAGTNVEGSEGSVEAVLPATGL